MDKVPTIHREGDEHSLIAHSVGQAFIWKSVEDKAKTYLADKEFVEEILKQEQDSSPQHSSSNAEDDADYFLSLKIQMEEEEEELKKQKETMDDDEAIAFALQSYESGNQQKINTQPQSDDESIALALQLQAGEEDYQNFSALSLRASGEFKTPEAYANYLATTFGGE